MSYTIYNTDGSILLTLADGKIDKLNTSLTLIGKNVNAYGEYLNNNLVRLLENFANTESPTSPRIGQLWYDTSAGRLKIYDLYNQFRPVTNTVASDTKPTTLAETDFWYDTINSQLYFSVDGQQTQLIGPAESQLYGQQGWTVETLNNVPVTSLYSNGSRVAILSTTSFALTTATGFDNILAGLNLNQSIQNIKFVGTATNADQINGLDITGLMKKDVDETTLGSLTIINNNGLLVLNENSNGIAVYADPVTNDGIILNETVDGSLDLQVSNVTDGIVSGIYIKGAGKKLGIWNSNPSYQLDVSGDTRIQGNLYVDGTLTNITSVNLQINDKQIELGYGQGSPSDTFADQGGIVLHGATDHSILWSNNGLGWGFTDNVNILSGNNSYYINGAKVLNQNSLGLAVTSAPGLTSLGILSHLTVTNVYISGNTIQPIGTGVLNITATNYISVGQTRVTDVPLPVYNTDVASKEYVDNSLYLVGTKAYGISLDGTNFPYNFGSVQDGVKYYLDQLFPIFNSGGWAGTGNIIPFSWNSQPAGLLTLESTTTGSIVIGQHLQPINGVLPNTYIIDNNGNPSEWIVTISQTVAAATTMVASGDGELDIPDGVRAKVLVGSVAVPTTTATVNVNWATDQVDKGGFFFTATVVAGLAGSIGAQLPAQSYTPVTTYTVQTWRVLNSQWTFLF